LFHDLDVQRRDDVATQIERAKEEDGGEQVVGEGSRDDGRDACEEAGVRVAALVLRVDLLEWVHAGDLHEREKRDQSELENGSVLSGLVPPDRRTEPDAEPDDL